MISISSMMNGAGRTQIRDGVAIDRDSETAKNGAKYDFEVVPSTTVFGLHMVIENATEQDLQLISIGLGEFVSGFGGVGGFRSRGLGACILNDLEIRYLDLTGDRRAERKQRLQRYLLQREKGTRRPSKPKTYRPSSRSISTRCLNKRQPISRGGAVHVKSTGKRSTFAPGYHHDGAATDQNGLCNRDWRGYGPRQTYRNGQQEVYLPGSSLKGVFRSHIEKVINSIKPQVACNPLSRSADDDTRDDSNCTVSRVAAASTIKHLT